MHKFVRCLITEWRRLALPVEDAAVVVAVSGGADSVSLLLGLHELRQREKLKLRIVAAHFNHRLRKGESDMDEDFVKGLTSDRGIELAIGQASDLTSGNIEQNARLARYAFLKRTAINVRSSLIVTGHTINDQAETFLMNLVRGSGPEGLRGMAPVREMTEEAFPDRETSASETNGELSPPGMRLARPLITWAKRLDTESYCRALGVEYRYDTMNDDTAFKRVRIRRILLPLLEDMNPRIVETLANTAMLMQHTPVNSPERNRDDIPDELKLSDLRPLSEAEMFGKIRSWLRERRGNTRQLQLKHIRAVERLVQSTKSGRTAELPGGKVVKTNGRLVYRENKVEKSGTGN